MTRSKFFLILFLGAAVVFAVFVWPTRYRDLHDGHLEDGTVRPMRVDRLTERIEFQNGEGEWVEYAPPPPDFDPQRDTDAGRGVAKTRQAEDDIRKMNEVTQDVINNGKVTK